MSDCANPGPNGCGSCPECDTWGDQMLNRVDELHSRIDQAGSVPLGHDDEASPYPNERAA